MKTKETIAVVKILAAGAGWGMIGVFSRPLGEAGLTAVQLTFIRSLIVILGIGLCILIKDRSLFKVKLKDFWIFLGMGMLSIIFFNICYFLTIQRATLAAACILLYTAPCFVLLMSAVFFHEKITAQKAAALVIAFAGCALVSGFGGEHIGMTALLTGIGSGLGYASYSIFGTVALKKYESFPVIFYTFLVAAAGLLPFVNVPQTAKLLFGDSFVLVYGIGLGVVSTVLPYIFYTGGLQVIEAGKASVLAFSEPMVAAAAGILIFREKLHWQNLLGIALIFLAIVLLNLRIKKERNQRYGDQSETGGGTGGKTLADRRGGKAH